MNERSDSDTLQRFIERPSTRRPTSKRPDSPLELRNGYRGHVLHFDLGRAELLGLDGVEPRLHVEQRIARVLRLHYGTRPRHGSPEGVHELSRRVNLGNGRIDRSEFRRAMTDLGIELSSSELTRVIRKFDKDGDGTVSVREFVRFAEGDGERRGGSRSPGGGRSSPSRSGYR